MNIMFSFPDITEAEIEAVAQVMRSGWITTGSKTGELEAAIARYCGTKRAVCMNSQTACAEMVLRLLEIGAGDEVIVPAYTYTATASVVAHVGAGIVMVDSGQDSPLMDYDRLEDAITERTKAIIPVDIGGVPCDYQRIFEIVERKRALFRGTGKLQQAMGRIAVVADAAHALGAERNGMPAGVLADFTTFSFHASKNLTTAEGGALTWNPIDGVEDDWIHRQLRLMAQHGQDRDAIMKALDGNWEYDIVGLWYKHNMPDTAAAMGLSQLNRYDTTLAKRHALIGHYNTALASVGIQPLPHVTRDYRSSGHLYITRVPGISPAQRNEIIGKMAQRGIACNVHYKPLPLHTAYRALGFDIRDFPNALAFYENEITLPLYTKLTEEEADYVIRNYTEIVKGYLP